MEFKSLYKMDTLLILTILMLCTHAAPRIRKRHLTSEEQLIRQLFQGYEKDARSVENASKPVTVTVQLLLLRIQQLDERGQLLLTTGLLLTDWQDERLQWIPAEFSNITDVVVRAERIWTPELAIINGAEDMIQDFERIRVLISWDGSVHWEPGGVFTTTCDIDITYFPFDTQACLIEIGAWAYKSSRMNLTNSNHKIEMDQFSKNGEWDIIGTSAAWHEITLPMQQDIRYSKVVFTIYMNRRYTFYVVNIILPCALLSTLILIVFCVPPDAGEKISVGISVLLAFTVFLLMLADNVPRTSLDTPVLVIYLASTMSLGTASVCLTVVVLNLHHRGSHTALPQWARVFFLKRCARVLLLPEVYQCPVLQPKRIRPNNVRQESTFIGNDVMTYTTVQNDMKYSNLSENNFSGTDTVMYEAMAYHPQRDHKAASTLNKRSNKHSNEGTNERLKHRDESIIAKEWRLLARVVDRIFFCVVFLIMFVSASFILLSPWYAKKFNLDGVHKTVQQ